jgi:excinuclease ABC subunit B
MEMMKEVGFCKGIENYSRHFSGRHAGDAPSCLLDYFPPDYLCFIDESHQTIPQIHAMYKGDRARKQSLVEFGFRLPSAYDNRPLRFEEFQDRLGQVIFVSATPGKWEQEIVGGEIVEQIIRPTGLLDPPIEIRPAQGQIDDALEEIRLHTEKGGRVLVTTLTKKLAETLTSYLIDLQVKAKYLHSDIDTLERVQILRELRIGTFDVLVGINLLREGLDLPEVSLVAILDADKEGFLRSTTSLIQTCGRAARNSEGRVIMYADKTTQAIANTVAITERRRQIQSAYNLQHGITPQTIQRGLGVMMGSTPADLLVNTIETSPTPSTHMTQKEILKQCKEYEKLMRQAAKEFRFEEAARYRDLMHTYTHMELTLGGEK